MVQEPKLLFPNIDSHIFDSLFAWYFTSHTKKDVRVADLFEHQCRQLTYRRNCLFLLHIWYLALKWANTAADTFSSNCSLTRIRSHHFASQFGTLPVDLTLQTIPHYCSLCHLRKRKAPENRCKKRNYYGMPGLATFFTRMMAIMQ